MRSGETDHVLFLCRDNAVLSPMAEALLNHSGRDRLRAASAGWRPASSVHALAVQALRRAQVGPVALRTRRWEDMAAEDAPPFRAIVLLGQEMPNCVPPPFKGDPLLARWPLADPTIVIESRAARERAFAAALGELEVRVRLLASLALGGLDRLTAERRLAEIELAAG